MYNCRSSASGFDGKRISLDVLLDINQRLPHMIISIKVDLIINLVLCNYMIQYPFVIMYAMIIDTAVPLKGHYHHHSVG